MNWTIGQRELKTHHLPIRRLLEIAIEVEQDILRVTPALAGKAEKKIAEYTEQLRIVDAIGITA